MKSEQEFVDAIYAGHGIKTKIARVLGVTWVTVHERIKASDILQTAMERAGEVTLDNCEEVIKGNIEAAQYTQKNWDLIEAIKKLPDMSDEDKQFAISQVPKKMVDSTDAKWMLKHKGKHRGYTERTELTGANGVAIDMKLSVVNNTGKDDN